MEGFPKDIPAQSQVQTAQLESRSRLNTLEDALTEADLLCTFGEFNSA